MLAADTLSATLSALADPTRRAILARLAEGGDGERTGRALRHYPAGDLAAPQGVGGGRTLRRGRAAQWRPCRLEAAPLQALDGWLARYRRFWEGSFDKMDAYLDTISKGNADERKS